MSAFEFILAEATQDRDTLHISSKRIGKGLRKRFSGYLTVNKFIDKDTKQFIFYAPSFEISGYGESEKRAFTMLKFCLDNLFDIFSNLPPEKLKLELNKLGWKKERLRNKDFSNASIDPNRNLKNYAAGGKVERLALVA
jgi:hypothetical protein